MATIFGLDYIQEQFNKQDHIQNNALSGNSGELNPFWGLKHTKETIELIRSKNKLWRPNAEQLEKMKNASKGENNPMYGRKHSEETKRIISEKNKGKLGTKHTQENMLKFKLAKIKHNYISPNGTIFQTRKDAGLAYNVNKCTISNWCKDQRTGWIRIDL
jgi:hypothetical protein